ncbi:MAG TPA: hypothetical protein VHD85_08735 [Terracidiphilus sp.]|nr:hypothetical protein [Terracidiphilus sp.]
MRTTIDIPDEIYRAIKVMAAERGTTVRELVLQGVEFVRRQPKTACKRFAVPVIPSKRPGTLNLTNEQIDELTAFS